jgi:hypothetical protein
VQQPGGARLKETPVKTRYWAAVGADP